MDLNQITIPSMDLYRSVPFYQKLGLKLIVDSVPNYVRFECPKGNSTFSIHHTNDLPSGEAIAIYFETEHLDDEVERLIRTGVKFDLLPTDQSWLWREARLRDPDGNRIILYFGGKNRKNPPWRIS